MITGFAGQISLCQATFAAIGACRDRAARDQRRACRCWPRWSSARCIAAVVGALLALPMLRLGGIFLSLATLAFAFFFEQVILQLGWVGGGTDADRRAPPADRFDRLRHGKHDKAFLVLTLIVLVIVSIAVIWVRSGTTGRCLDAMRGSEVAAASIGISRHRARIVAFALSAAIAGLGGGLLVVVHAPRRRQHRLRTSRPSFGLVWIVLVVTLGSRTVEGAINAAVGFVFFQAVVLPTWIPLRRQPRAALVPHGVVAGRAAADPVRPRCVHLREAPRGYSRVPEAPLVRAHPGGSSIGSRRSGKADVAGRACDPAGHPWSPRPRGARP